MVIAVIPATAGTDSYSTLTFVKTDGSKVSFSVDGLIITYDDYAHAIITNEMTTASINLTELDYMYFGDETGHITGDVNGDGEVSIADVNAVIYCIVNGNHYGTLNADVNGDGEVSIADINAIINIILN